MTPDHSTVYGSRPHLRQLIRFCTSTDGIAYSTVGSGPPLVKAANRLNHLEYEWESPAWKHWIAEISRRHLFVRYDERGCGLSGWNVQDLSFDAWVRDQETVVEGQNLRRRSIGIIGRLSSALLTNCRYQFRNKPSSSRNRDQAGSSSSIR